MSWVSRRYLIPFVKVVSILRYGKSSLCWTFNFQSLKVPDPSEAVAINFRFASSFVPLRRWLSVFNSTIADIPAYDSV